MPIETIAKIMRSGIWLTSISLVASFVWAVGMITVALPPIPILFTYTLILGLILMIPSAILWSALK